MIIATQKDLVLKHLQDYGSITSIEAIDNYKITRLAHHIWELKTKDKLKIVTERVKSGSPLATGRNASYGVYRLVKVEV
jgi:hypothetical protein